jgi:hypothetical protein
MIKTEISNGKRDTSSGDLKEIYMFLRDFFASTSRSSLKDPSKNRENHWMEWILTLIRREEIPNPACEACLKFETVV